MLVPGIVLQVVTGVSPCYCGVVLLSTPKEPSAPCCAKAHGPSLLGRTPRQHLRCHRARSLEKLAQDLNPVVTESYRGKKEHRLREERPIVN